MRASPRIDAAAGPNRAGLAASGPILAICCLLFVLFLIAATVILALIPVYVSSTGGSSQARSSPYSATLTAQNATADFTQNTVDSKSLDNLGRAMESATNLNTNSIIPTAGTIGTDTTGKRRRRGFGSVRERRDSRKVFCQLYFNLLKCNKCSSLGFLKTIQTFYITASVYITAFGSFQTIRFYVVLSFTSSTIPSVSSTGKLAG